MTAPFQPDESPEEITCPQGRSTYVARTNVAETLDRLATRSSASDHTRNYTGFAAVTSEELKRGVDRHCASSQAIAMDLIAETAVEGVLLTPRPGHIGIGKDSLGLAPARGIKLANSLQCGFNQIYKASMIGIVLCQPIIAEHFDRDARSLKRY